MTHSLIARSRERSWNGPRLGDGGLLGERSGLGLAQCVLLRTHLPLQPSLPNHLSLRSQLVNLKLLCSIRVQLRNSSMTATPAARIHQVSFVRVLRQVLASRLFL